MTLMTTMLLLLLLLLLLKVPLLCSVESQSRKGGVSLGSDRSFGSGTAMHQTNRPEFRLQQTRCKICLG